MFVVADAPFAFMTVDGERAAARKYDYIVVGGGTAGCPLAATLSTKYSVLVVERGGSPYGIPTSRTPMLLESYWVRPTITLPQRRRLFQRME
jgi:choline dehydrogenase-like flavoprotein